MQTMAVSLRSSSCCLRFTPAKKAVCITQNTRPLAGSHICGSSKARSRSVECRNSSPGSPANKAVQPFVSSFTHECLTRVTHLKSGLLPALGIVIAVSTFACLIPNAALAASDAASGSSSFVSGLISFVLHLDKHLSALIQQYGTATYAILWAIVFCETGLVITPFLPGDSLLFATGAFAGMGVLNLPLLMAVLLSAAILGDGVNYAIGNKLGHWMTQRGMVNPRHIKQTEEFYQKYGGKTIVLARFLPIVRTFAPFVAGVGSMQYSRFALYNVAGALIWTIGFVGAGFFFGNLPAVKHNFTLVVLGIIVVSCLPVVWELYNASKNSSRPNEPGSGTSSA